ncbi:MAG: AlkA N-terminal domain-containing protein [Acidimicrobiales bacterium]
MVAFSAVVTTGIYCRPGCGARPLARNVLTFDTAAAAEAAGFRACLQCRPYRSPQPVDWAGPELVCRAVRLILAGALDGPTEADLGARLGVSARHLRRLFATQVGATPDQLARSARTHFARRLLDDTDLTITEIAFASGFGSPRQLNRACQEIFRATPRELRARRRVADRLAADGGLLLRLPFRGPLDWPAMLAYLARRAIPGVEHVTADVYRRTVVVDGGPGVLELLPGAADHLLLRAHLPHWAGLIHVVERARRLFNLDADLEEAARHLGEDQTIGQLLAARPGLRVPGTWDPFEIGVRAIVGQQVSVAGATTIMARLVERHGTKVPGLGPLGLTHTFPPAHRLAVGDLDGLGLTRARGEAVRAFARAVAEDEIRVDRSLSLDQFVSSITSVPGLGPWTAHYIALRLGERDAFPAADLGLRRALAKPIPPSTAALTELADRWRPWRSLAAIHLWMANAS